jgi:acyl dehydratase
MRRKYHGDGGAGVTAGACVPGRDAQNTGADNCIEDTTTMHTRYLEDFTPGEVFRTRGMTMDESAIMEFARQYDPQPIHIDKVAADAGPFEGLIASGFHTHAVIFRLWMDLGLLWESSMGGPGADELRFTAPVRPGDTLRAEVEVLDVIPSRSKPDRGIIQYRVTGLNQRDETVLTVIFVTFVRRRPEG